ncbi:MAG TPA: DUF4838 domain-containing protein [bacterium]|nr:DUF4838 domain-containing protein [bacterium]
MNPTRILLILFCLAFLSVSVGEAGDLAIVKKGQARLGLVLPAQPQPEEQTAAEELCHFVEKMSGVTIPRLAADTEGPSIFLGRADCFRSPEIPADILAAAKQLKPEEFLIEARKGNLYLLGGDARGAMWAVYDLLDGWGCRWYMPGDMGEIIPHKATLSVDETRRVDGPDFFFRQIWYSWGGPPGSGPRMALWHQRNRLYRPPVMHGHNLTNTMPESASFEKRPELYSLIKGHREPEQVCTTNPEVIELIAQSVNQYFDKYPECLCYSLCPDDNDNFCECENCRALDPPGWDADRDRPIVTDRYVTFLNEVSKRVQERHPGKLVSMYAYINHSTPPVRTPVSPYIAIFLTASVYCGGHGIGDPQCESRMKMKADLEGWARVCPNIFIYEYDPIPGNLELFWPLFGARVREMPVYRKLGVRGMSVEGHCSWATLSPNHWFSAQSLWNADRDSDALLWDFCNGFFGENPHRKNDLSRAMFRFYSTLENALRQYPTDIDWGYRDIPAIYPPEVVQTCQESLNRALECAEKSDNPVLQKRMEMVCLAFDYLKSFLALMQADKEGAALETVQKHYDGCQGLVDKMYAICPEYIEVNSATPDLKEVIGERIASRPPKELQLINTWNAIGPFDNVNWKGHTTACPLEREINLQATYDGVAGPVKWKQISSGESKAYVDLLDHFSPTDWVSVYAQSYVHSDSDRSVQLRVGSNDGVKMWLNGQEVWSNRISRMAVVDADIVPAQLQKGWNSILLKVSQTAGQWGFFFRVTDEAGKPAEDLQWSLSPPKK